MTPTPASSDGISPSIKYILSLIKILCEVICLCQRHENRLRKNVKILDFGERRADLQTCFFNTWGTNAVKNQVCSVCVQKRKDK